MNVSKPPLPQLPRWNSDYAWNRPPRGSGSSLTSTLAHARQNDAESTSSDPRRDHQDEPQVAANDIKSECGDSTHPQSLHRRSRRPWRRFSLRRLTLKELVRNYSWRGFLMIMATGGISNMTHQIPFAFTGQTTIGIVMMLLNITLFLLSTFLITTHFYYYPSTFQASLLQPTESLFIPASIISIATILINITEYGTNVGITGPWLLNLMVILFWVYCALALTFSCTIYVIMWSTQTFNIAEMTPVWIFPTYPLLLVGPFAARLSANAVGNSAIHITLAGFVIQGLGFLVSLMVYASFHYRLMTQKLPYERVRPGMFISVGPSGFTISAIIGLGINLPKIVPDDFLGNGPMVAEISRVLAIWAGLWLWGLAMWFCVVAIASHWSCLRDRSMRFDMTWYSYVFPNTALTTATFAIAKALNSQGIRILGCVFAGIIAFVWLFVFGSMVRSVVLSYIVQPRRLPSAADEPEVEKEEASAGFRESA